MFCLVSTGFCLEKDAVFIQSFFLLNYEDLTEESEIHSHLCALGFFVTSWMNPRWIIGVISIGQPLTTVHFSISG